MDLHVDLRYTRDSRREYEIISELDIDREHTRTWDDSSGSPVKHIYGEARLHGGRNEVTIQTTNGHVRIEER